jgi:H+/Cl- antiporter ClcA
MNRRLHPWEKDRQKEWRDAADLVWANHKRAERGERLWVSILVFLAVLAFVGLLSVDDFEPVERTGTTEVEP